MASKQDLSNEERFLAFHKKNPHIYKLIVSIFKKQISEGTKRLSVRGAIYKIRENLYEHTTYDQGYKVNNIYTPYYADLIVAEHPTWDTLIIRKRKKPVTTAVIKETPSLDVTRVRSHLRRKKKTAPSHIPSLF